MSVKFYFNLHLSFSYNQPGIYFLYQVLKEVISELQANSFFKGTSEALVYQ